jgi:RNA polymerase sigma-70 factor (ECF subfamily)
VNRRRAEDRTLDRHSADEQIRTALGRDDPAAVELIWDRYAGDLLALLQAVLGSKCDAEDVLQTVFVRMVRQRRHLATARRLDAYVCQIARHEAARFLKRRRKQRAEPATEPWLVAAETDTAGREDVEKVQAALARLPAVQREVVVLKIYRDKTFAEIGRLLALSQNTVASRYRYALEKLRALLREDS